MMNVIKSTYSTCIGLAFLAVVFGPEVFSQKSEVEKILQDYNIPEDFFVDNLAEEDATHTFNHRSTTVSDDTTKVIESSFDPTRPEGERWNILKVDGREPTEKERKQFNKDHNKGEDTDYGEPADEDWTIFDDNDSELIIGFRYRAENLPRKYKFLAQCLGKVYINKESRGLEKVEFYNTEQIKVKIFKVDKLDMVQYFEPDPGTGTYLIEKEELLMDVRLFGQQIEIIETNEFMDYVKVK